MQRIREQQERLRQRRRFSGCDSGLAPAVGVAGGEYTLAAELPQQEGGFRNASSVARGARRMGRALGPLVTERQIEAQDQTASIGERLGYGCQKRGAMIRPGAVGQDKPIAGRRGRAMQHAAYTVLFKGFQHRSSFLSL